MTVRPLLLLLAVSATQAIAQEATTEQPRPPFAAQSEQPLRPELVPQLAQLRMSPLLERPKPNDVQGANFFRADKIDGNKAHGVIEASGNVQLRNRKEIINADWARYSESADLLEVNGNVRWRSLNDAVSSNALTYSPTTKTGFAKDAQYSLGLFSGKGSASRVRFEGEGKYGLDGADYTTCKSDLPAWCLAVTKLDIDTETEIGVAHGAKLMFFNIPVFYWPSIDFPLGRERKSGVLAPTYSSTGVRGFELQVPYYLNLAPDYDATVTPRLMSKRGLAIESEFRYLVDGGAGKFDTEYLPKDRVTDTTRSSFRWQHEQQLIPGLFFLTDFARVSDDTYFVDLGNRVAVTSISTLPRIAAMSYRWGEWLLGAKYQRFQTLQDPAAISPVVPPYEKVPELTAHRTWRNLDGLEIDADAAITRFEHAYRAPGIRSLFVGTMKYPWRSPGAFLEPKITLNVADYQINSNDVDFDNHSTRVSPMASLDAGLIFERNTSLWGRDYLQTFEPRLFYTYIPYSNQTRIPNFDSALKDFNFSQLFQENRYSGNDRIGDANQITLAATTRYLESNSGREYLRLSLGERFYFRDQQVNLGETVRERSSSDVLMVLGVKPRNDLALDATMQFNSSLSRVEQANISTRFSPEPRKFIGGSFRYIREIVDSGNVSQIKQGDIAGQWPLQSIFGQTFSNWYGVGRVNYSFTDRKVVEAVAGLEYDGQCWVGRLVVQRLTTGVENATNSIFWQIELNGLSRIGTNPLDVLRRNIPGYQELNNLRIGRRQTEILSDVFQPLD